MATDAHSHLEAVVATIYRWQVSYEFAPCVPFAGSGASLAGSGVTLDQTPAGIAGLTHQVTLTEEPSKDAALTTSWRAVGGLIVALRFLQAKPISWRAHATRIEPPEPGMLPALRMKGTGQTGPRPIPAIPTQGWHAGADSRIATWLTIAAEAQESPSAATSLRLYGLILEEMEDATPGVFGHTYECLQAIRHFLSHPAITKPTTVARLHSCAPSLADSTGTFAFNPNDAAQRSVLESFRDQARALVDPRLRALIGVP